MNTERVKALLRREWKLSRKFYLSSLIGILGMTLLFVLFELSMRFGNLNTLDSDELAAVRGVIWMLAIVVTAYGPICQAATENGVFKSDIQANWLRYSYTLPITPTERAGARMLLLLIVQAAGFLLSVLGFAFSLRMLGWNFSGYSVLILLAVLDISLIAMLVQICFIFRARDLKTYSGKQTKFIFTITGAGIVIGTILARKMTVVARSVQKDDAAVEAIIYKFEHAESVGFAELLDLVTWGHADSVLETARHLLPLTIPLTAVLYVLLFLVTRSLLKGAWSHDRSAL